MSVRIKVFWYSRLIWILDFHFFLNGDNVIDFPDFVLLMYTCTMLNIVGCIVMFNIIVSFYYIVYLLRGFFFFGRTKTVHCYGVDWRGSLRGTLQLSERKEHEVPRG